MVTNVQIYNNPICDASDSTMHGASEEASAAQPTETEVAEGAKSVPTERVPMHPMNTEYRQHSEKTIADDDGNVVVAQVITPENSDGKIEVYSETPLWGENFNYLTAEELDSMQRTAHNMNASAEEETAPETESEETGTSGEVKVESEENAQARNTENGAAEEEEKSGIKDVTDGVRFSNEVDENGRAFVRAADGTTVFGEIRDESGLPAAPIKLSEGFQDADGKGYGLAHIEANHGEQIRNAGFASVEDFVSFVAKNYDENNIRVGKRRDNGSITYLLQVTDKHDNTLFVELSHDGSYWNVNSAGIFRKGYSNKKETVAKTEPQQPNNAVSTGSSLSSDGEKGGNASSEPNGKPTVSAGKDSEESGTEQEKGEGKYSDDAMPMIGEGEDAEADFLSTTPERGQKYVYEESGLEKDEADEFVANNIAAAEKALADVKAKAPKMGTSIAKYNKEKAAWKQKVDAAQAAVDYWNGVRSAEESASVAETENVRETENVEAAERSVENVDRAAQGETEGSVGAERSGTESTESEKGKGKSQSQDNDASGASEDSENGESEEEDKAAEPTPEVSEESGTEQAKGEEKSSGRGGESASARQKLSDAEREATEKIAAALGVKVEWVDTMEDENGVYDEKTKTITVALDAENPLDTVFGHEATHRVKALSGKAYERLKDAVRKYLGEDKWRGRVKDAKNLYNGLTREGIEEEVVCDVIGEMIHDKKLTAALAESLSGTEEGRTVLSVIRDLIRDLIRLFGEHEMPDKEKAAIDVLIAIDASFREAAKVADQKNTMPGDVITNAQGDEVADVDEQGNIRPKYSHRTFRNWTDNLGVEHQGTRERILEFLQNKQMPKEQIDKFMEIMDYWADLNEKIANLVDENGNFKFKAFHEWSQQTPLYRRNEAGVVRAVSTLVSNGEYPLNFELTTDCIKREAFTQILNEMLKFDGQFFKKLTPATIVDIQELEKSYGIQVACPLCFVEGKRLGILDWAKKVVGKWNEALDEVTGGKGKGATAFGFGDGTYVPESPLDEEEPQKRQAIIRQLNEVSNLLSSMDGVLPEDLEIMRRNQQATDVLLQKFKDEYAAKHDGSEEGFVLTRAQEEELTKQTNTDMRSAKARMVKAMAKFPELRHRLEVRDLLGSKGLMAIRSQNGEAFEQLYSLIISANGTGTPKAVQDAQPYDGEIIDVCQTRIDNADVVGGARLFSFSDFDLTKVFDIMQIMFDCAARDAKVQSYSKEIPYILMFGKCGVKINMSMLPEARPPKEQLDAYKKARNKEAREAVLHDIRENAGLEIGEDGKIKGMQLSDSHSVSQEFAEAIYRNPEYNKNCGAIMVGISANHTIYAMCQNFIRQVIPFHLSGMPVAARKKTDCIYYKDFTSTQNTGVIVNGKRVKLIDSEGRSKNPKVDSDFNFYEGEDEPGWNMRDRCREYVKWCKANGNVPRFEWAVNSDGYRKYCEENGYTPNQEIIDMMDARTTDGVFDEYYKVITDYTAYSPVFDENGVQIGEEVAPHKPVTVDFGITPQTLSMVLGVDETGKNINDNSMLANRERSIENADRHKKEIAMKAVEMLRGNMTLKEALREGGTEFENNADNDIFMEQTNGGRKFSKRKGSTTKEEERIVEAARADGTYMKAPNGKPSKLNERQWAQVRTKAFKEWFGDWENDPENASKVVDENGEPMVVYHGTPTGGFSVFGE